MPDQRLAPAVDELDDVLAGYGLAYRPGGPQAGDLGIRAGDRYVAEHDPLRAWVEAPDGAHAAVELGVDPGGFYCADQMATLLALGGAPPLAGATRVGFIHVPPDRGCVGDGAADAARLPGRASNLELAARVLAVLLRGLSEGTGDVEVIVTGFGPFAGVADNPTAAIVGDAAVLDRALALAIPAARREPESRRINGVPEGIWSVRHAFAEPEAGRRWALTAALLPLAATPEAALRGDYFPPEVMAARFRGALEVALAAAGGGPPAAIVSLGVDSGQLRRPGPPAFRIETQTRGWGHGEPPRRDLGLARIFLEARRRGDPLLRSL